MTSLQLHVPSKDDSCFCLTRWSMHTNFTMGQCKMQPADFLWTIVFRVRKQWDNCCHILICMVKTIVHSLHFTLTDFTTDTEVDNINITSPRGIKNWNRVLAYFSYLSTEQWPALVTCDLWHVFCTCQISCFTLICLICTRSPGFTWWFKP